MIATALYILSLILTLGYTTFVFFIAQYKKDNSIIDISYGIGFIVVALLLLKRASLYDHTPAYSVLIFALILIWGIRLSLRIYKKNEHKGEDFRYAVWRKLWMQKGYLYFVARTYLQIFILQGIIISIVLLPFTISLSSPKLHISNISFGLVLWIIGFIFESTADKQLDTFIKNRAHHKRTIMTTGLFRYSRHPNYFGESLMWWGIAYIAYIATGSLLVFLSPLLITYLLLFVSGVPMLEKKWKGNKEWEIYKSKTSVFFPLPERE